MPELLRCSLERGIIADLADPLGKGRVKVNLPFLGEAVSVWAQTIRPPTDPTPLLMAAVGDEVLVAFMHGDIAQPYVLGIVAMPAVPATDPVDELLETSITEGTPAPPNDVEAIAATRAR
jgi:hypothetical protein